MPGARTKASSLALPEALDAAAAPALLESLCTLRGGPVEIDAAGVKRLGGQCAQVLLSAAASWRADGAVLRLAGPSPEFVEALRLLGLTPEILSAGEVA